MDNSIDSTQHNNWAVLFPWSSFAEGSDHFLFSFNEMTDLYKIEVIIKMLHTKRFTKLSQWFHEMVSLFVRWSKCEQHQFASCSSAKSCNTVSWNSKITSPPFSIILFNWPNTLRTTFNPLPEKDQDDMKKSLDQGVLGWLQLQLFHLGRGLGLVLQLEQAQQSGV